MSFLLHNSSLSVLSYDFSSLIYQHIYICLSIPHFTLAPFTQFFIIFSSPFFFLETRLIKETQVSSSFLYIFFSLHSVSLYVYISTTKTLFFFFFIFLITRKSTFLPKHIFSFSLYSSYPSFIYPPYYLKIYFLTSPFLLSSSLLSSTTGALVSSPVSHLRLPVFCSMHDTSPPCMTESPAVIHDPHPLELRVIPLHKHQIKSGHASLSSHFHCVRYNAMTRSEYKW